jgi:hypothetical protein
VATAESHEGERIAAASIEDVQHGQVKEANSATDDPHQDEMEKIIFIKRESPRESQTEH